MKLQIKNIDIINDDVIEFNGITVIAGENNTGKSTVGKALFALCNSFYDLDRKIKTERRTGRVWGLYEKDFVEEALVSYHKSIELNPENAFAQNNLGIVYMDGLLDAEEALEYFEEAINIDHTYTLAYFNAGRASQKMGFTNDAANYYQMALDLNKETEELDEEDIMEHLRSLFEVE